MSCDGLFDDGIQTLVQVGGARAKRRSWHLIRLSCLRHQQLQKFDVGWFDFHFQRTYTMPKRRRERDRPKAAHDAPFNPNKRVLLSYESDEEVEDEDIVDAPEKQALMDRPVAAYTEDGPVEREAQAKSAAEAMMPDQMQDPGEAQQEDDEVLDEDPEAPHANEASLWTRGGVRKNEYTGQWAALGSLAYQYEDGEEDEEFESEEEEAMAYLRGVR